MANNVTIPAVGVGSSTPVVETFDTTGSGGPQRQMVGIRGANLTPAAGAVSEVATGGTAVTAVSGPLNGGFILNPINAAAQGISAAENLYIDMVGTPGGTDATANGTTSLVTPGATFSIPGLASGVNVMVNASTSGHKFTVVKW